MGHEMKAGKTTKIEIRDATPESIDELPRLCRICLYWQSPKDFDQESSDAELKKKKRSWYNRTQRTFGNPGKILYYNGESVGYAQYAHASSFPQTEAYESGPIGRASEGVVFLSCLYICEESLRRKGMGLLLESVITDMRRRGFKAIETYARKGSSDNPSGPIEFYLTRGFEVKDEANPEFPLLRLNL
jgi:GNAT superfamily N-acetyltransferase